MKSLTLVRFCYAPEGTFGWMDVAGYRLYTVECPWLENRRGESCIPETHVPYECEPSPYHRGGYDAVEVTGVPDRSRILFHKANWPHQLRGCIAPVWEWGCLADTIGGEQSGRAFGHLMQHYGNEPFLLTITHRAIDFTPWRPPNRNP